MFLGVVGFAMIVIIVAALIRFPNRTLCLCLLLYRSLPH